MFTGQGSFCRKSGSVDVMMGAMNLRKSLSSLHAECEALIWTMECIKTLQYFDVVFARIVLSWWRWCRHLKNGLPFLHTWKNSTEVRRSSPTSGSDIFLEHKIPWRTSLHVVRRVLFQLCFTSIQLHRFGLLDRLDILVSTWVMLSKKKNRGNKII